MKRRYVKGSLFKRIQMYLRARKSGCHEWIGACNSAGYGKITADGKQFDVHRLVYQLAYGPLPSDVFVCHTCDNPSCAYWRHLFAGTPSDNIQDALAKGRPIGRPPRSRK